MAKVSLPVNYYDAVLAIKDALSAIRNEFYEVRVFGSCVRSSAMAASDVDLLVLTEERLTDRVKREEIRERAEAAAEPFGVEVDIVFYSLVSYQNDSSEFTSRLRKESKGLLKGEKNGL